MIRTIMAVIGAVVVIVSLANTLQEVSTNAKQVALRELDRGVMKVISYTQTVPSPLPPPATQPAKERASDATNQPPVDAGNQPGSVSSASEAQGATEAEAFGEHTGRMVALDECCIHEIQRWVQDGTCLVSWNSPAHMGAEGLQVVVNVESRFGARLAEAVSPRPVQAEKLFLGFPALNGHDIAGAVAMVQLGCGNAGQPTVSRPPTSR